MCLVLEGADLTDKNLSGTGDLQTPPRSLEGRIWDAGSTKERLGAKRP